MTVCVTMACHPKRIEEIEQTALPSMCKFVVDRSRLTKLSRMSSLTRRGARQLNWRSETVMKLSKRHSDSVSAVPVDDTRSRCT